MHQAFGEIKRAIPARYKRLLKRTYRDTLRASRNLSRRLRHDRLVVVVGSANRVGSTWLYQLIHDLGHFDYGYDQLPVQFQDSGCILLETAALAEQLRLLEGYTLFKTHSYPLAAPLDRQIKFVSIYRDPRDVITSNIFSLTHLRSWDIEWGEGKFRQLPEAERIKIFIREADYCIAKLEQWYHDPFSYRVGYEELKRRPVEVVRGVADYLGLRANTGQIRQVVERNTFERTSGRKPGQEKKDSPMRKGIVNDWRNYFDAECIAVFKTAQDGRWNRLLIEMGYEQTPDWQ